MHPTSRPAFKSWDVGWGNLTLKVSSCVWGNLAPLLVSSVNPYFLSKNSHTIVPQLSRKSWWIPIVRVMELWRSMSMWQLYCGQANQPPCLMPQGFLEAVGPSNFWRHFGDCQSPKNYLPSMCSHHIYSHYFWIAKKTKIIDLQRMKRHWWWWWWWRQWEWWW